MCPLYSEQSKPSQSIELKTKEIRNSSRLIILLYSLFWFRNSGKSANTAFFQGRRTKQLLSYKQVTEKRA